MKSNLNSLSQLSEMELDPYHKFLVQIFLTTQEYMNTKPMTPIKFSKLTLEELVDVVGEAVPNYTPSKHRSRKLQSQAKHK